MIFLSFVRNFADDCRNILSRKAKNIFIKSNTCWRKPVATFKDFRPFLDRNIVKKLKFGDSFKFMRRNLQKFVVKNHTKYIFWFSRSIPFLILKYFTILTKYGKSSNKTNTSLTFRIYEMPLVTYNRNWTKLEEPFSPNYKISEGNHNIARVKSIFDQCCTYVETK